MSAADDTTLDDLWEDFVNGPDKDEDLFGDVDDPAFMLFDYNAKLDKYNVVLPNLIVGGDDYMVDEDVIRCLLARGVTHALDCRTIFERQTDEQHHTFTRPGERLSLGQNHTDDDGRRKSLGYFYPAIEWADSALRENPDAVLYVHCAMGVNRGPSNALAIMRACMGLSMVDAMTALRMVRPAASAIYWKDVERDIDFLKAIQSARRLADQIEGIDTK